MQSSGIDNFSSMPTLNSEVTTSTSDSDPKNAAGATDIGLTTAPHIHSTSANTDVYVVGQKKKWIVPRKCDWLFKKICIVHTLLVAAIWILYTIPIFVFYATDGGTVC